MILGEEVRLWKIVLYDIANIDDIWNDISHSVWTDALRLNNDNTTAIVSVYGLDDIIRRINA